MCVHDVTDDAAVDTLVKSTPFSAISITYPVAPETGCHDTTNDAPPPCLTAQPAGAASELTVAGALIVPVTATFVNVASLITLAAFAELRSPM